VRSIRARLLVSVIGAFIVFVVLVTVISYRETAHEVEEVFDAELAQTARMISQLVLANLDSRGVEIEVEKSAGDLGHKYEKHISYQVWLGNALMLRSISAPVVPLARAPGYSDILLEGKRWRVFALYPKGTSYGIFTAEDYKAREELLLEIVVGSLGLFFWSIPVLTILVYLLISHGLSSLVRLSRDVSLRDVNSLRPLDKRKVPDEVLPIVTALNSLLGRLDAAILRERRFTSDASHELRTPLSGIRLHAQMAMMASTQADREHSLKQIIKAVDRSTHLVEQLLTLYRLQPGGEPIRRTEIDVVKLCRDVVSELEPMARKSGALLSLKAESDEMVMYSNREMLHAIIRNLVDNAMRHTGDAENVELVISHGNGETSIRVSDDGPGIPEELLHQVTQRFYRISGQEVDGCGLGLAIVSEAANAIGCRFELGNRADGRTGLVATLICTSTA